MKKLLPIIVFSLISFSMLAQTPRTVIVEHFTNSRCGICASKNPDFYNTLNSYPDVLHIAYHPSSPYSSCLFSQHNPKGNDDRTKFYGIYGGTPKAVLQGSVVPAQAQLIKGSQLDAELGKTSAFSMLIMQSASMDDSIEVRISIHKTASATVNEYDLYAVLAEKQIDYNAPNGEKVHHDVFREVLEDEDVMISQVGDSVVIKVKYKMDDEWQYGQMYVVAMLQNKDNKEILQAAASNMLEDQTASVKNTTTLPEQLVFPNPATTRLTFAPALTSNYQQVQILNLQGEVVFEQPISSGINVEPLRSGTYILRFKSQDGTIEHRKFIKAD